MTTPERRRMRLGPTNSRILRGAEDLSQWEEEELYRGQRRDKDGHFRGRKAKVVSLAVHREITRRQMQKVQEHLRDNILQAAEALTEMIHNPNVDDGAKVKAITMVFDRVLGKAPEKVEVALAPTQLEEDVEFSIVYDEDDLALPEGEVLGRLGRGATG